MQYTEQERRARERPSFTHLYFIALQYALNSPMTVHRAEKFAENYANCFEDQPRDSICSPRAFIDVSEGLGLHYHG
jgi:hypothetical protein